MVLKLEMRKKLFRENAKCWERKVAEKGSAYFDVVGKEIVMKLLELIILDGKSTGNHRNKFFVGR